MLEIFSDLCKMINKSQEKHSIDIQIYSFRFPDINGKSHDTQYIIAQYIMPFLQSFSYIRQYCSFKSEPGKIVSVLLRYSHNLVSIISSRTVAW